MNSRAEVGMFVIYVGCQVNIEMSPRKNELRLRPKLPTADEAIVTTLQTVPGVGLTKARALLQRFQCTYVKCCAVCQCLYSWVCLWHVLLSGESPVQNQTQWQIHDCPEGGSFSCPKSDDLFWSSNPHGTSFSLRRKSDDLSLVVTSTRGRRFVFFLVE